MDSETAMRRVVQEVALALAKYADKEGWKPDEYRIYYHENLDWDVVIVIFVSEHFNSADERKAYVAVWHFLAEYFKSVRTFSGRSTWWYEVKKRSIRAGFMGSARAIESSHPYYPIPNLDGPNISRVED